MAGILNFVLGLEDKMSSPAAQAAAALKKLSNELSSSEGKLEQYEKQLERAKELGNVEGFRKYSKLVEDARKQTFELADAFDKAGGTGGAKGLEEHADKLHKVVEPAEVARHALEGVGEGLRELASAAKSGDIGGVIEGIGDSLAGVASTLDLVVPGLGQAASAVIKAGAGIVGVLAEIAEEGVKTALEVNEVNEKLTSTFDALGEQGPGSGKKTLAMLDDLSKQLPQSREQLAEWTKSIEAMGTTDLSEIQNELKATASAEAIGGKEGAAAYEGLRRKISEAIEAHHGLKVAEKSLTALYKAGVNVTDVADRMGMSTKELTAKLKAGSVDAEKFGNALQATLIEKGKGPLDAMNNSVGTLKTKGLEVFNHLFDGIDITPITDALKGIISLGDQANPSGQALKEGIGGALKGIIDWMGHALQKGAILFLSLELWAVTHKGTLKALGSAFEFVGNQILQITQFVANLFAIGPPAWLTALLPGGGGALGGAIAGAAGVGGNAPAHAEGGLVKRPAAGEFFASVAPGEMILPSREVQQIRGGFGSMSQAAAVAANGNGGGGRSIEIGQIVIQAPQGVTDAHQLSVTGLTLALERMQLGSGR